MSVVHDLPAGLMPESGWIRRYVDLYTPMSEAPAEAHLGTALAVLSAAIGWRAYIQWGESAEPCNLFVLLEGGSATAKKTTTMRTGSRLVDRAVAGLEDEVFGKPLSVRSIGHASGRGLIQMVGTPDPSVAAKWETIPPPGVLLDWDEFGQVLGKPGDAKSADWLGQVRTTLMQIYGGRHSGIQTGALVYAPSRCAVSVLGTMTRQELEQRISTGLLRDGFMGRFVMIPNPGRRVYLSEPPVITRGQDLERGRLADFLRAVATSTHELGSVFGRMTPAARELRSDWYQTRLKDLDAKAREGGEVEIALADAMSRLQTTAVKVAAVLAVAGMEDGENMGEVKIDDEAVHSGIRFVEMALTEVASLASQGGGMPADRYAERVVDYLSRRNGHGPIGRKELMDTVRMDGMDAAVRWRVIERLHAEGRVDIRLVKGAGRPKQEVSLP